MSIEKLTDRNFWLKYWKTKDDVIQKVEYNILFSKLFQKLFQGNKIKEAIEIGGFPGYYSIYFKKYYNISSTLFDFVVHPNVLKDILAFNNCMVEDVKVIEDDIFKFKATHQFDLVFSNGFIEHFENAEDIIQRHLNFLREKGNLFIVIPNFKGINGLLQLLFDKENYRKHYIECMDRGYLKKVCENLSLKNINVFYYGKFGVWLENIKEKSFLSRFAIKIIWFIGKITFKIFPIETKLFSPYIVIIAQK